MTTLQAPPVSRQAQRAITWRSVLLGLLGVVFICGLTPYNDYALNNTFLVGNNLPIGVVMVTFLFILLVNGPLSRWAPDYAFGAGEITVALAMTLVSCALPSSGLMRYFVPSLVSPFWHAGQNAEFAALLESLNLPRWIFPSFSGEGPAEWAYDPIVTGYIGRWTMEEPIPYRAWITPAITWGIFLAALAGALVCMVTIVRRQWVENERLPFPLAQIYLSLIEQPERGRMFNGLLRRGVFWLAFAGVFLLHGWNGMHRSLPEYFPEIPVGYNLIDLFTEAPWVYAEHRLKEAFVYFTVIGVIYFLSSAVAFSLWAFFILFQIYKMMLGTMTGDSATPGHGDAHFGGVLAFAMVVIWIGRRHWGLVIAQALRGEREGEARGRYLPYPWAFWGLIGCTVTMIGWLVVAGSNVAGAVVMVLLLLLLFFTLTRMVAETGLVHAALRVPIHKPFDLAAMAGWNPVSTKTFFHGAMLETTHYDYREIIPVYASHGVRAADQTIYAERGLQRDTDADRRIGRRFIALLMLALAVGYIVSFASMLWTNYNHGWTKDVEAVMPINRHGTEVNPRRGLVSTLRYEQSNYHAPHNPAAHFTFGFALVSVTGFLRLMFTWWPLHPIGFLLVGTFPGYTLWFSIMLGWLAKVLIVRFGGAKLYLDARPFFIGLIVGEALAAGFWLGMGILLSALDVPYAPVRIMPW